MSARVLVYRIGSLGDTLVSMPALWAVRQQFSDARVTLLCNYQVGKRYVLAADLLRGSGVADDFLLYPSDESKWGRILRPLRMAPLLLQLRRKQYDTLVYLAPSQRTPEQVERDRRFFAMAGIRNMVGMEGFTPLPPPLPDGHLPMMPREADLLLRRLQLSGIAIPPPERLRLDLDLQPGDESDVERWLAGLPPDGGRTWVAIGPGSKMPAKIWPAERYAEVVRRLIAAHDVWPVIFGGAEDRDVGRSLLEGWGRGYNAAGALGLRPSAAALRRCALYLGNDTGTMHMAAAAGVPCVALFSWPGHPGQWYPYGPGHQVFRTTIECEGCGLVECIERGKECLMRISADEVFAAASEIVTSGGRIRTGDARSADALSVLPTTAREPGR